ncbi:MAG: hypothetical protein HY698_15290, partial [Deltaproteobacteria bacterium]|nr:hypothetical protein [Deltaproteobacteria bacterium]
MPNVSRRDVLVGMGAAVGATVVGCGGEGDVGDVDDVDVDGSVLLPEPDAGLMRSPEELLSKIDHLVVLCMENRSFDHYLGSLRLVEGRAVDGLGGHESTPVAYTHLRA